jgi:hypothetical protein
MSKTRRRATLRAWPPGSKRRGAAATPCPAGSTRELAGRWLRGVAGLRPAITRPVLALRRSSGVWWVQPVAPAAVTMTSAAAWRAALMVWLPSLPPTQPLPGEAFIPLAEQSRTGMSVTASTAITPAGLAAILVGTRTGHDDRQQAGERSHRQGSVRDGNPGRIQPRGRSPLHQRLRLAAGGPLEGWLS